MFILEEMASMSPYSYFPPL